MVNMDSVEEIGIENWTKDTCDKDISQGPLEEHDNNGWTIEGTIASECDSTLACKKYLSLATTNGNKG